MNSSCVITFRNLWLVTATKYPTIKITFLLYLHAFEAARLATDVVRHQTVSQYSKFAVRMFTFTTSILTKLFVINSTFFVVPYDCVSRAMSIFHILSLPHLQPLYRSFFLMLFLKCSSHKMVTGLAHLFL